MGARLPVRPPPARRRARQRTDGLTRDPFYGGAPTIDTTVAPTTRRAPTPAARTTLPALVAGGSVILYLAQVWILRSFITDDAFISLRYARNFAEGHGPVWNPGGAAVEGFSNPLLVVIEALAFAVGADAVAVARGIGVAAGLALLGVCWFWGRRIVGEWGAAVGMLFVAATPGIAYWSVGGLETLPMALLLTAATLLLARPDGGSAPLAGALLALLPWIRPEGLAVAAALVFFSEVPGLVDRQRRGATLRRLLWLALIPVLSQALLQALRWSLYGNVVPNSVLYKTGTGAIGVVTLRFLTEYPIHVALAVVALFRVRGRTRLLVVPAAVYLVASLSFLNSVNQFSRLLLPTLPQWALLAGAALPTPVGRGGRRWVMAAAPVAVLALLMVLVMPASLPTAYASAKRYMGCKHVARLDAGLWLRSHLSDGDTYVIADAGVVPFYADGTAYDLFNLNEASLQEAGSVPAAVRAARGLDLQPRFLVVSSRSRDRLRPHYGSERRLVREERFDGYELRTVTGPVSYWQRTLRGSATPRCDYFMHIFEDGGP